MSDLPATGVDREVALRFSQRDYDEFARLTGDDNPIHVDPDFSARTRFGRTVAHGMFLFSVLAAEAARWLGGPVHVHSQELMFTAPTFTDEEVAVRLRVVERSADTATVAEQMVRADGEQTCVGRATLARSGAAHLPVGAASPSGPSAAEFKGLRPGMQATESRAFDSAAIEDFRALVDDPNPLYAGPQAIVPPPLLGGVVSCLLGVELPGPGTNWLKQQYRFAGRVGVGEEVHTAVEVVRLRPDKALVNLVDTARTARGIVMEGDTLVLAADVTPRHHA